MHGRLADPERDPRFLDPGFNVTDQSGQLFHGPSLPPGFPVPVRLVAAGVFPGALTFSIVARHYHHPPSSNLGCADDGPAPPYKKSRKLEPRKPANSTLANLHPTGAVSARGERRRADLSPSASLCAMTTRGQWRRAAQFLPDTVRACEERSGRRAGFLWDSLGWARFLGFWGRVSESDEGFLYVVSGLCIAISN